MCCVGEYVSAQVLSVLIICCNIVCILSPLCLFSEPDTKRCQIQRREKSKGIVISNALFVPLSSACLAPGDADPRVPIEWQRKKYIAAACFFAFLFQTRIQREIRPHRFQGKKKNHEKSTETKKKKTSRAKSRRNFYTRGR